VERHVTLLDPRILTSLLRFLEKSVYPCICLFRILVGLSASLIEDRRFPQSLQGEATTAPLHFTFQEPPSLNSTSFLGRGTDRSQWPLTCWDCGFESGRRHGCPSFVNFVCCEVSATGRSLAQRNSTECVCITACDQSQ
jgi:hypothetical protein